MAFSSSSSTLSPTPNVTPLIDVLLVLLIIFMVIVPVSPRGLDSLIPRTSGSSRALPKLSPSVLEVLAGPAGEDIVYKLNGKRLDAGQLRTSLSEGAARTVGLPLFIDGDRKLDYGAVTRAVAEARRAGYQTIGLLPRH